MEMSYISFERDFFLFFGVETQVLTEGVFSKKTLIHLKQN